MSITWGWCGNGRVCHVGVRGDVRGFRGWSGGCVGIVDLERGDHGVDDIVVRICELWQDFRGLDEFGGNDLGCGLDRPRFHEFCGAFEDCWCECPWLGDSCRKFND